jgi:hypothetical protein
MLFSIKVLSEPSSLKRNISSTLLSVQENKLVLKSSAGINHVTENNGHRVVAKIHRAFI